MPAARPKLITDGLFARTCNPNYPGKILIYSAYATMALPWLLWIMLGAWAGGCFVRNMLVKDRSLARNPEFAPYRERTGMLLPKWW